MANYIVSYDLNGPTPIHKQMDEHLSKLGKRTARVLETVWWVEFYGTTVELRDYVAHILSNDDRILVCKCSDAAWKNLLVDGQSLADAWGSSR
jgi:hypothetical protein